MKKEQKVLLVISGIMIPFAGKWSSWIMLGISIFLVFWSLVVLPEYYRYEENEKGGGDDGKNI
jgi:membrane protein YdbS with pleckstrin-like domain